MSAENHPLYMEPLAGNRPTETTMYLVKLSKILRKEYTESLDLRNDIVSYIDLDHKNTSLYNVKSIYCISQENMFNLIESEDIIENV